MNLLDLFVKIGVDDKEYVKGLNDAELKAYKVGQGIGTGLNVAGKAMLAVGKTAVAAVGVAATGITALAKQSVSAYGETQQLIGGVETLFGAQGMSLQEYADSVGKTTDEVAGEYDMLMNRQTKLLDNASNAYQTAGLSANQYMETVTSFAAALNSSLGENAWQSANYADMAITDMADNANKMGTSMESIQNAYQGFAKQNYTMLDNLKLGYGGTKGEMERLMRDAEKMEGYIEGSLSIDSFADVAEAIHIVQENLGITGTTAKEAGSTIQGSFNMMQGAWQNLVAGFADPEADIGALIGQMVDAGTTYLQNLIPTITQTLTAIGSAVGQLAPVISEQLPVLIEQFLPVLIESATTLIQSLAEALPEIFQAVADVIPTLLPQIIEAGVQLLTALAESLPSMLGAIIAVLPDIMTQIIDGIISLLPMIVETGLQLIVALALGIAQALPELMPTIVDVIIEIVDVLTQPDNLMMLIDAALVLIVALAEGLIQAIPRLVEKVPIIIKNIVTAIVASLPKIVAAGVQILLSLWDGAVKTLPQMIAWIHTIPESIRQGIVAGVGKIKDAGVQLIAGLWNGIKERWDRLIGDISNLANGLVDKVRSLFGIASPSKVFAEIGNYLAEGLQVGWDSEIPKVEQDIKKSLDFTSDLTPALSPVNGAISTGVMGAGIGYNQVVNITSPEPLSPYEVARQTRNATRDMVLALSM